jgi:hypothetical protein
VAALAARGGSGSCQHWPAHSVHHIGGAIPRLFSAPTASMRRPLP